MKKLLVLTLVLGMASLASAAFELIDLGGGAIGIEKTDVGAAGNVNLLVSSEVALLDAGLTENAGGLSGISDFGVVDSSMVGLALGQVHYWQVTVAPTPTTPTMAGVHFEAMFDVPGFGTEDMGLGSVGIYDEQFGEVATLFVVPEPATLALLGLGVLALRRKK